MGLFTWTTVLCYTSTKLSSLHYVPHTIHSVLYTALFIEYLAPTLCLLIAFLILEK